MPERRRRRRGARRRRRLLIAAGVAAGVIVLAAAWFAWVVQQVSSDLSDAQTDVSVLTGAFGEGDIERAQGVLDDFQESSNAAADSTDSISWDILERMPFYGDDARALATVSEVLADLGEDGVQPLVDSAEKVTARAYAPQDGQFPLADIAALEAPTTQSYDAFHQAAADLAEHDSADFVDAVAKPYDGFRNQVEDAEVWLETAVRASRLMPSFLGADGERNYLYVFQNNAEVRSTGGLPGNISLVNASGGKVEITRQATGAQFGEYPQPVLPLTDEEIAVYGPQLGTYFLDANFTPDFPRAADLWRARWQAEFAQAVDGVFTVDPVTLSYLLEATGPVTVNGVELTADNVVQVVENLVYINLPDAQQQDDFLNAVAKKVFNTFASGAGDPVLIIEALYRGVAEGRVRIHSFTQGDQAQIAGTTIAGELPTDGDLDPHAGVYFNDATGSKMSYYLQYAVNVAAVSCADDRQKLLGRLEISSKTPPRPTLLPEFITGFDVVRDPFIQHGQQLVVGDIFAPVGGQLSNITLNGELLEEPVIDVLGGRELASMAFLLEPRETHLVTWEMTTGPGQGGDITVSVTPGVAPENESSTVPSVC